MHTRRSLLAAAALFCVSLPLHGQDVPKRSPTWESHCAVCHGPDGKANTEEGKKKGARNLTDAKWQALVSDDRLASSIRRGRDKMPSFGKKLTEAQVRGLIEEVRSLVR